MRILGAWGPIEAAYVRALVISEKFGVHLSMVRFLIDSGASRTSLLDSDAERLEIDLGQLQRFGPGTTGIGGVVDTFILPDVTLLFRTAEGLHEERLSLFVLSHGLPEPETADRIKKLPSLLGRDILNMYRLVLDRGTNLVLITDER